MSMESQEAMYGMENSATPQSSNQPQLSQSDNKMDDSVDNQQQVRPQTLTPRVHPMVL